jgi:hypothetical protein
MENVQEFCNKTVPIYICETKGLPDEFLAGYGALPYAIYIWLYEKCFKPYRSDIEWGQFIASVIKFIIPNPDGDFVHFTKSPEQLVDYIAEGHAILCDEIEATRQATLEQDPYQLDWSGKWPSGRGICHEKDFLVLQESLQFFTLRRVFRAVVIAVNGNIRSTPDDMGPLPVYIIRTGVENQLTGPVVFDSIREHIEETIVGVDGQPRAVATTLEIAIKFIEELENREMAVFGPEPDPFEAAQDLNSGYLLGFSRQRIQVRASRYGWQPDWGPVEGPSSSWVDTLPVSQWIESCKPRTESFRKMEKYFRRHDASRLELYLRDQQRKQAEGD